MTGGGGVKKKKNQHNFLLYKPQFYIYFWNAGKAGTPLNQCKKKEKHISFTWVISNISPYILFLLLQGAFFFFIKVASHLWFYQSTRQEAAYCQPYKYVHTSQYICIFKKNKAMHFVTGALSRCAASSPCAGFPAKGSVPVFEELLEDDGLLSLWQDFHL